MAFPEEPCDGCPRDPARGPCLAVQTRNPRYCMHVASGREDYRALLAGDPPAPASASASPDRAAIERRRAGKARVALGVRVPPGRR